LFPYFELFGTKIYIFWITITLCFFLFLWMLKKLSFRFNYDFSIFTKNLIWLSLSTFIFSRIFQIISRWTDIKYITFSNLIITSNYDFSLFWSVFWFLIVLFIILKLKREPFSKYFDWLMLSFLLILFVWYIWAFFWWQVEWTQTNFWIELLYWNNTTPIFPLAILYSIIFFLVFSWLYILSIFVNIKSFIWYLWTVIICLVFIVFENLNWKFDIVKNNYSINFTQLLSIILLIIVVIRLLIISKFFNKKIK